MTDYKTIEAVRKWARTKASKFEDDYQETGNSRTLKSKERYEDIADICDLALKAKEEADTDKARRERNRSALVAKMKESAAINGKTKLSVDEVARWMMEVQL